MNIGRIINQYREQHSLSMQEFADKAGLSKGYISMLEKGRHPQNGKPIIPSIETVDKLATAMGVSIDTLLERTDANQEINISHTVPLYEAAAGEGRINDGYPEETYSIALDPDQIIYDVHGRSMEPTIMDGDMVVITPQSVIDYPRQIALVKINGEADTLKRVEVKPNGVMLIGDNVNEFSPRFFTDEEVESLPVTIKGVVAKLIREM